MSTPAQRRLSLRLIIFIDSRRVKPEGSRYARSKRTINPFEQRRLLLPACAILKLLNGGSMIDPVQLPILMKAVDFVFDEGRKILEERRERRKQNNNAPHVEESQATNEIVPLE